MEDEDERYMRAALSIAEEGRGRTDFAPSIGCVLVKDGAVIGRGRTQDGGVPHAEETALGEAIAKGHDVRGATAYVTLEPCATPDPGSKVECTDLLIRAGIGRVVMAVIDPDPKTNGEGLKRLQAAGIETKVGVMREEAITQNEWFYRSRGLIE
jgi:diaminohydroxyphosphoribosylaminopyrimidine deaminase/5-amino-6-(5-phosphoribosylamino)uracil reductase